MDTAVGCLVGGFALVGWLFSFYFFLYESFGGPQMQQI